MSSQANIRDIQVLGDLKAAFGRFGEDVLRILPSLQKQFEEVQERLEERQRYWGCQVDEARDELREARHELHKCHRRADQDDDYVDCGFEEERVSAAEKTLAECEANFDTVKRWRHRIEDLIAGCQNDIHRLSDLSSSRTGSTQTFLANKIEILNRYVGGSSTVGTAGLHGQSGSDRITAESGVTNTTTRMREVIRNTRYNFRESLGGGINESFILKNGVKVVFKPAKGEAPGEKLPAGIQSGTQFRREKAASLLDELLGLGLVPPTEIITSDGGEGSAQLFKEGYDTAKQLHQAGVITLPVFEKLSKRQRQDWQLLDEVLGYMDRHSGNWMLRARVEGGFDLALIDNGLCLNETGATYLRARPSSQQEIDSTNRIRLELFLEKIPEWRSKFCDLVGVAATEHMIKRAQDLFTRGKYE